MILQSGLLPFSEMDGKEIHPTFHQVLVRWDQISTLNISEKCLYPVEHLLQLRISLGFEC
jgi:hypothetical protein